MSNYNDTLQRGDRIGCYRIEDVLGRGGFAVTYLATDENLDVEVAIKEYLPREITQRDENLQVTARKPEFAEDYQVGLESFAREAKTLARFKHPHIVRVHQVLHANNTAYMVMEFEHGQELGELLEKHRTLSEDEMRGILFPILDGVEEIHRHGFVHRDIKPSNIYVRHNGSPVLIDFGAARYTMSESTQQLTAVVTVGYTPIEQYNVSEDAQGPWSDIYALAAVCYEAVTGDIPTDSVTRASASVTNGDDPLPSVRALAKNEYSDDCLDAIDWGLRMESEDRPQVIAQWRDAFDGIFNPASAYAPQENSPEENMPGQNMPGKNTPGKNTPGKNTRGENKPAENTSIYASHRTRKPRGPVTSSTVSHNDDVMSVPLRSNDTRMDTGVVSLDADSVARENTSSVSQRPWSANIDSEPTTSDTRMPPTSRQNASEQPAAVVTANDSTSSRNVLRQDTGTDTNVPPQPPQRSKFERPLHLNDDAAEPKKPANRPMREEIEFDETDWNYEPPAKGSTLKLFLLPALGLAAVVGASLLYVNNPDLIKNLGNSSPEITASQALSIAEARLDNQDYIFPAGESALDYYNIILEDDPDNLEARAGVRAIETAVRDQIATNMQDNNLSEANRILERADDAGLGGLYRSTEDSLTGGNSTTRQTTSPTAQTSPLVTGTDGTVINTVDTASIEPSSVEPAEVLSSLSSTPSTAADNTASPLIEAKIAEIDSLISQRRFDEARTLYNETDRFIPDQSTSRSLLQRIVNGEADAEATEAALAKARADAQARQQAQQEAADQARRQAIAQAEAEAEAEASEQARLQANAQAQADAAAREQARLASIASATANAADNNVRNNTPGSITEPATSNEPPRDSYTEGSGAAADHLNELRLALEAKDIEAVQALSEQLPAGRIQFLNSTFARHHRLDVIIDNVTTSGDTVSGRLNVAMYGRGDDGSVYGAGKWNGAIVEATRSNGTWQKIRW